MPPIQATSLPCEGKISNLPLATRTSALKSGVLITSDEQTIVYLQHMEESGAAGGRFILQQLDAKSLFIKQDWVQEVNRLLQKRLQDTVFCAEDEEEEQLQLQQRQAQQQGRGED